MAARRFLVEDHIRDFAVYDRKRNRTVARGMTRALARRVAKLLNDTEVSGG